MKHTTETATPVVSAPILRANIGVVKKLKEKVQIKRRGYLNNCVRTIFSLYEKKDKKNKKMRIVKLGFP